ncbi:hypothetical protein FQA39_LY16021 [Lamprigera yunnana]|nr:hypothetical protein FQA39_LY16021 [Lamprigera yunnana]
MTIDFYYMDGNSPSRIVQLVAKNVGVELNPKHLDLSKKEQLSPEFIKINPQHCIPTIVDDGFVLWESNAIATYLIQKYGKDDLLYPQKLEQRAVIDQRLYYNNGVFAKSFGDYYIPLMTGSRTPDKEKLKKIEEAFDFLDKYLETHKFIAGDTLTVADIALSVTVCTFTVAKFDRSAFTNVNKWYDKIQDLIVGFEEFNGVETLSKIHEDYLKILESVLKE